VIIEQIQPLHEEQPESAMKEVAKETIRMLFPRHGRLFPEHHRDLSPLYLHGGVAGSFFRELTMTMEITFGLFLLSTWIGLRTAPADRYNLTPG